MAVRPNVSRAEAVVSLYISALCYLVKGSPSDIYDRLKKSGYLREDADQQSVTSLLELALRERMDSEGDEPCWHVHIHLVRAQVLSASGLAAARRSVTRDGQPIA